MANFDPVAGVYRWLEYAAYGRGLERVRFHFLAHLADCRSVLIVGEGDGRFLERLQQTAPDARIHCIDASPEMIARARQRLDPDARSRVTFECADVREADPAAGAHDAVVTLFVLDCFSPEDAAKVVERLDTALRPGGLWLFADYVVPEGGWRRLRALAWLRVLYTFFGITTGLEPRELPPSEGIIGARGLGVERVAAFDHDLLRTVLYRKPPVT